MGGRIGVASVGRRVSLACISSVAAGVVSMRVGAVVGDASAVGVRAVGVADSATSGGRGVSSVGVSSASIGRSKPNAPKSGAMNVIVRKAA